jgi:zinc protease
MNRRILLPIIILMTASAMARGASTINKDQLVLLPVKNEPSVAFRIWFAVGAQDEPAGKEGLASITASMLTDASTTVNSYEQILDKLFPLAASYSATSSQEMTVIGGRVHKDNLKDYYPLLMDAILRPAFKQEDLDRIKSQVLNYLENTLRYSSDEELGKAVLYTSLFKGTPYGHITGGTIDAVKSITLDDVRTFYSKHYTRENVIIGVGGGYSDGLLGQLETDLAALPEGRPAQVAKPVAQKLDGFRVSMVDKDAPATAISMGFPINVTRGSRDWYALAVANSWLGEHRNSSSHLYQVIREERGLNYGDYSYIEHFPGAGFRRMPPQNVARRQQIFEMWIRPVPNETRHFALRAALREFKRLVENGLTDEEFQLTRKFLSKYVLHYAETTEERLGYAIDDRFYNVPGSHLELFRKNLATLTRDEVNAAIKKYLQYGSMQIAIVTKDASSFKNELVNDTPSPITYKSPKPASVLDEDKEIIVFPVKVKPENITIVPVTEVFQK